MPTACTILVCRLIEPTFASVMIPLGLISYMRSTLNIREHVAMDEKSWICSIDLLDRGLPFGRHLSTRCPLSYC